MKAEVEVKVVMEVEADVEQRVARSLSLLEASSDLNFSSNFGQISELKNFLASVWLIFWITLKSFGKIR